MKTLNNLRNQWKELEEDGKDFFRSSLFFIPMGILFAWLISTNRPPVMDTPKEDLQTKSTYKKSYELSEFYNEYAQHCYDYGKDNN